MWVRNGFVLKINFHLIEQAEKNNSRKRSNLSEEECNSRVQVVQIRPAERTESEEEIWSQRSTGKAAKKTWNICDYLIGVISPDEESKNSASDSNDDCDPAWTPATLQVYLYKYIVY